MAKAEINLLPPVVKRDRGRQLLGQRLSRLYWWFTLAVVVTAVALGVSWGVLQRTNRQLQHIAAQQLGQRHDAAALRTVNQLVGALRPRVEVDRAWFPAVAAVLAVVPPELHIHQFAVAAGSQQLIIEGTTTSRVAVATFAERLKGLAWVSSVEAPLTNLVVGRDGSFSFTVQRKVEKP